MAPPPLNGAIELEGIEQALQVAESGHGLAMGRLPMVDDRLARGTLIAPFGAGDPTGAAYYLCRIADAPRTAVARRVERWLRALAPKPETGRGPSRERAPEAAGDQDGGRARS